MTTHTLTPKRIALTPSDDDTIRVVLVYQAGIANVFHVDSFNLSDYGRDAKRIYQGDYRTAESIAYGLGLAGATVRTAGCSRAGDIIGAQWTEDLEDLPWSDRFRPAVWN